MIDDNFKILEKVRSIHTVNRIPVTLSIGCAYGEESFAEQEGEARLALDLALGRGGDQVVIRADGETQTFGGRSQALAKNTRVRARVVAQAIHELISQADMVLVMGHAREDYDSLGAAVGVAYMATSEGVPAHVVISEDQETVEKLVDQVRATPVMEDLLISEEDAQALVTPQTVLFVVDTHKPEMTAAPSLVEMIQNRVVIDHHRRSNTFIPDPLLVYLEPSSSSTCELVTAFTVLFRYDRIERDTSLGVVRRYRRRYEKLRRADRHSHIRRGQLLAPQRRRDGTRSRSVRA